MVQALETLEALHFLTQTLEGEALEQLSRIRAAISTLTAEKRSGLLVAIKKDISEARAQYGAIAPDSTFRKLLADARARLGYAYLPKIFIDKKLFTRYDRVFSRWPYVPLHGFVVFDGQTNCSMNQIFTLEGALYDDITILLERARGAHKGIDTKDFRLRPPEDQRALLAFLHSTAVAIFHFLESYLNGLAYDCFQTYHDALPLDDHDLLAEWDSARKRVRFVSFETKIYKYPMIVGRLTGSSVNPTMLSAAPLLVDFGKQLRDALTHPTPHVDPRSGEQVRVALVASTNLPMVEHILAAAKEYVLQVERALGRDPEKTMPWFIP